MAKFQGWLVQHWYEAVGLGVRQGFVLLDTPNGKGGRKDGEKELRWNY